MVHHILASGLLNCHSFHRSLTNACKDFLPKFYPYNGRRWFCSSPAIGPSLCPRNNGWLRWWWSYRSDSCLSSWVNVINSILLVLFLPYTARDAVNGIRRQRWVFEPKWSPLFIVCSLPIACTQNTEIAFGTKSLQMDSTRFEFTASTGEINQPVANPNPTSFAQTAARRGCRCN